jgi:hypothetical protein
MNDKYGPVVAGHFYQELFRTTLLIPAGLHMPALHKAITKLGAQWVSPAR